MVKLTKDEIAKIYAILSQLTPSDTRGLISNFVAFHEHNMDVDGQIARHIKDKDLIDYGLYVILYKLENNFTK